MGINPTPTNHRSFTFDGKSTREFGVYTTGKDVFNSPERAVEMISIPGRDGEYALDKGHFTNIEVTYRAGIVADSTTDFAEAISNFRNWLASRKGYCRLTDEYNTEEYRMAVFKNAIALEHEGLLTGEFDVTFDCKPQRYLAIGEELVEIGAWGNTETVSGDIATFDAGSATKIKEVTVDITPVQSGSGTPSPDNIRPITGFSAVDTTVCGINIWDEEWEVGGISNSTGANITSSNQIRSKNFTPILPNTSYYFRAPSNMNTYNVQSRFYDTDKNYIGTGGTWYCNDDFTTPSDAHYFRFAMQTNYGTTYNNDISINYPSTDTDYHAYNGTNYTTSLGTTVYGGTLDVVSGVLTTTYKYIDLGDLNWDSRESSGGTGVFIGTLAHDYNWSNNITAFCSNYAFKGAITQTAGASTLLGNGGCAIYFNLGVTPYLYPYVYICDANFAGYTGAQVKTAVSGVQLVYELATPTTTQLTATQVQTLLGTNHIFADSGDVAVEYGHNPTILTNPTWFPSKPNLQIWGVGDINLGEKKITVTSDPIGETVISNHFEVYGTTTTVPINVLANVGDVITLNGGLVNGRVRWKIDSGTITDVSVTAVGGSGNESLPSSGTYVYLWAYSEFSLQSLWWTFEYGVASSKTVTCSVALTTSDFGALTGTLELEMAYDGDKTITITISETLPQHIKSDSSMLGYKIMCDEIIIDSTYPALNAPLYLDLDIGEAYVIENDSVISMNNSVVLPSDLPTLPSGDTEVTYDNTITKVEVKPNWWKV